jgi:predicted deacylase
MRPQTETVAPLVWDFDPFSVPPGETQRVLWAFADTQDDSPAALPLIVIAGERPGATAVLIAGIHGDEYEGPFALWRLAEHIKPADVSGRLLIVPVAHQTAYREGIRPSPVDSLNLARVFPGDSNGTITERLAHHLFDRIVRHADVLVDCHSGGVRLAFLPVAGFYPVCDGVTTETAERSLQAAQALGLPWLWQLPPRAGVLSYEAARVGVAVCGGEIGGRGGRLDGDSTLYHDGIWRVLQVWGLLDGQPDIPTYTSYLDGDWQLAPINGAIENHVELGERVRAGALLATIRGVFGEPLTEMRAPFDGIIMGVRHLCSVKQGEWATCVVEERPF